MEDWGAWEVSRDAAQNMIVFMDGCMDWMIETASDGDSLEVSRAWGGRIR